jgi:transposase
MPAVPPYIIEPVWEQFEALLPDRKVDHPLGCHRPRIPDRVVFEKLVEVLIFGCAYWRIADEECSATTLRRRRDEWIEAGVMDALEEMVLGAYDSKVTRWLLQRQGLVGVISEKGRPALLTAGLRWVVERTNSWHNAHKKLVWCTEREEPVIDFWIAFSNVVIIVRRLIREAWRRYRWEERPARRP